MSENEKESSLCSTYVRTVVMYYWRIYRMQDCKAIAVRRMFCCDRQTGPWQADKACWLVVLCPRYVIGVASSYDFSRSVMPRLKRAYILVLIGLCAYE